MSKWFVKLASLGSDDTDVPHKLTPDLERRTSDQLDTFVVVTEDALSGSVPFPGLQNKHLTGFSNICTHMGCRLAREGVALSRDGITRELVCGPCPCHGTTFNLSRGGVVVLGPASQHLPQLALTLSDDDSRLLGTFPPANEEPIEEQWPVRQLSQQ